MVKKHSFIEWIYVVGAHWNCLYEAIPMCTKTCVTEIRETYFEIYAKQVSCPLAFLFETSKTGNQYLNTCHYMANCLIFT